MSEDDKRPFELEDEKPDARPKPQPKSDAPLPQEPSSLTYAERAAERENRRLERGATSDDVDSRTLAERKGADVPRGTEEVGPPADWPGEAFSFPLRKPGPRLILFGIIALLPLDVMGALGAVAFFAWLLKLLLVAFILRAQIFVAGSSAAGHDNPVGWERGLSFDRDDLWPYARTVLLFVLLVTPGCLVLAFGNAWLGLALLVFGCMYAAVVALGAALQDPGLALPWRALAWIGKRPLACLAGCAAWWMFVLTEWSLLALAEPALPLVALLSLVLRAACFYALLVSARALGVMGRAWSAL